MANILIAEDDMDTRMILTAVALQTLRKEYEGQAHSVSEAADGQEAIDKLANDVTKYDLVITDLMMPRVDGYELQEHVKANYDGIPVIITSANVTEADRRALKDRGFYDVIPKPFENKTVEEKIINALEDRLKSE